MNLAKCSVLLVSIITISHQALAECNASNRSASQYRSDVVVLSESGQPLPGSFVTCGVFGQKFWARAVSDGSVMLTEAYNCSANKPRQVRANCVVTDAWQGEYYRSKSIDVIFSIGVDPGPTKTVMLEKK